MSTDKEGVDYEQRLKDLQEEYNEYMSVVLAAKEKERECKLAYEDSKFTSELAEKKLDTINKNIITTKQLLNATMR